MRIKTIIILVGLLLPVHLFGQSLKAILFNPNVYRTRVDLTAIRLMDVDQNKIYNDTVVINADKRKLDYKVISQDENGYLIIRILPKAKILIPKDSSKAITVVRYDSTQLKNDSTNAYNYYFAIKKDQIKPLGKTLLHSDIVGTPLVQPFRLRPAKKTEGWTLGGEFTLSYNFGLRIKLGKNPLRQNFLSFIPYGFGVGTAQYFKENPDGTLSEKEDAFAVTYYQGGVLITLGKVNIGAFTGFDAMIDKKRDWFYQGEPWISFGLGYKFKSD
ncbi:hypothetical protein LVD17_28095 [Fulvivirga ulvae]|uniref:hypothetical protein n=1 Tax=Fulvivirga ulvae TaxID=2904245 RepID=UPI001F2E8AEE|nr:hypothetical protein [Fulvivirga ulvae]UII32150.1 hypothetical protein LVD17_28095 [Fulvivirga ulvae]